MGNNFSLKDFHEKFLSFSSSPAKYIRAIMLQEHFSSKNDIVQHCVYEIVP